MGRVIVVGAGVVGLTCAVRLLEAGHRVDVVARDLPLETTSAVAAALVHPYRAGPADLVERWTAASEAAFAELVAGSGDHGVRLLSGTDLERGEIVAPVVDMSRYLPWLVARVEHLGGTLTRLNLPALPDHGDLVVNCSGLGARLLGADRTVLPVAGQVVVVEQVGLERFWLDARPGGPSPTYVVPRESEIVVGGTDDDGEWSRTPSPEVAADILRRASALVPDLATARVLRHKVGLRPGRPTVRLERVGRVVHCYGHGGAGVTLSWGCADDVVALA
ncbi:FAD-dependent oxidoreductase [Nocardioides sp.]|uniref:FAD-dependent oxidoreductase n=1 Tax=Nocardioides sp. TaxID=35761 RepID=UPI002716CDA6|nr:FAD-dependent oxidoreductase [Nocardioides sp.]MDO9456709.1 FAD-dependent oxidoreductase [Nocardioides sp.]